MTIEEKQKLLRAYWDAGVSHICAAKAAPIMDSDPHSIRLSCRDGYQPSNAYFFSGNRCKISVLWLMKQYGVSTKKPRRRGNVEPGAVIKNHYQYTTTAKEAQAQNA